MEVGWWDVDTRWRWSLIFSAVSGVGKSRPIT